MYGDVDAEARLDAVDEGFAEGDADIDDPDMLAVLGHRLQAEDAEAVAAGLDAGDRPVLGIGDDDGLAPRRDVVAEGFRVMHPIEGQRRRLGEGDERDARRLEGGVAWPEHGAERVAIVVRQGVLDRRQPGDDGADGARRPALVFERGDDALVLQLELLIERGIGGRLLFDDGKRSEEERGADRRRRDGQDEAS